MQYFLIGFFGAFAVLVVSDNLLEHFFKDGIKFVTAALVVLAVTPSTLAESVPSRDKIDVIVAILPEI